MYSNMDDDESRIFIRHISIFIVVKKTYLLRFLWPMFFVEKFLITINKV